MSKNIVRSLAVCFGALFVATTFAYSSADCSAVNDLANQGLISYRSNCSEYNLDKYITRQEVAAVALKVAETCGVVQNTPPVGQFYCENIFNDVTDNSPNTWACRAIETLANNSIVSRNNSYFRPLQNITRNEALVVLLDSAGLPAHDASYDDWRFTNTDAVNWQKPIIQYAFDNGIISSIATFGPNKNAYRKEIFNYAQKALSMCSGSGSYNYNNNYSNNSCAVGQYWSGGSCYSCTGAPWNAYYSTRGTCTWTCNSGYYKSGNTCVSNNTNYYNNNYNTQCGSGQYWTGTTCYSCLSAPANSYYTSTGTCDWTCNSGYYKSGNTCVSNYNYNNNYYGTTGQCGSTINSCISGSFYDAVDSGTYAYWNCAGTSSTAYCSSQKYDNYGTSGQCSTSIANSCVVGYSSGYYTSGNYAYWNCTGTNSSSVSCSMYNYNNTYGTTGQCSTIRNTCTVGYVSGSYDSGNYSYWNCIGSNGTSVSCSAYNSGYYGTSGQCSTIRNTCTVGYVSGSYTSGNYSYWNCIGSNGTSVSCSAYNNNYNTYCSLGQYSSGGSCYSCTGLPYNGYYTTAGSCDWTCNSGYYKSGNTCVSNYNNYGTSGQCSTSIANSCVVGYSSGYYTSGNYAYWNCTGTNSSSVSCSMYNYNNTYGTTGQCSTIRNTCTVGYVSGSYDSGNYSYWNCIGSNGTSVSCSAYNSGYNTCGTGYTWNSYTNTCILNSQCNINCLVAKPTNAYYTSSQNCWACNAGYTQVNNTCVWSGY